MADPGSRIPWLRPKDVTRVTAAVILVLAAAAKLVPTGASPIDRSATPIALDRVAIVATAEFLLAAWLISGRGSTRASQIATFTFSSFAGFSLGSALAGRASCGCFGPVAISPWTTFSLDAAVLILLLTFRPPASADAPYPYVREPIAACVFVAIGYVVFASTAGRNGPAQAVDSRQNTIDADAWLGRALSETSAIATSEELDRGRWTVIFHRPGCHRCEATLAKYADVKRAPAQSMFTSVIAVEVVSRDGQSEERAPVPFVKGRLIDVWPTVATPLVVQLEQGRVVQLKYE